MRLFNTSTPNNWRKTFEDSVQVDYAPIPTGETVKYVNEEGQEKSRMVTVDRPSLGFQTETGRGKGIQWIPADEISDAMDALQHYAENGVESTVVDDDWKNPADSIHETICRTPRRDSDGNAIEGQFDISFRVRMGKGSKSCRVPEEDFAEFVDQLTAVVKEVPGALKQVEAKRAEAARKKAEAAAKAAAENDGSTDGGSDDSDSE